MKIRALLWSLPFLLHKALGWNEYVIPQHSAFHFCPLTMAFYRVIGCMYVYPSYALVTVHDQCKYAHRIRGQQRTPLYKPQCGNKLPLLRSQPYYSLLWNTLHILSRCVFISELPERARNTAAYVSRMCDPDDPEELQARMQMHRSTPSSGNFKVLRSIPVEFYPPFYCARSWSISY